MANWSNPQLTSTYTNFVTEVKDRDVDLALQFDGVTASNLPTGAIRWNSSINRWQKWNGSAWGELTSTYALNALSVSGTTSLATATATTPATADNSTAVATTAWVRAQGYSTGAGGSFLPLTGGTISGDLTVTGTVTATGNSVLGSINSGQIAGLRNRIINGDMAIDQRNAGALVNPATANVYTLDRWVPAINTGSISIRVQQNLNGFVPPAGFPNYLGVQNNTAYSVTSSDNCAIQYRVEGNSIADFNYGSASTTRTSVLSFWVRSSATGTFGGSIRNGDNNRSYPFSYTISSANTWEYKTVVIPGDTTGTWLKDSGIGMRISFSLGSGSTFSGTAGAWVSGNLTSVTGAISILGTVGANWNITGVQLELGSQATPYEHLPRALELAMCQRYFCKTFDGNVAPAQNAGRAGAIVVGSDEDALIRTTWAFPVEMRAAPTVTTFNPNAANANWRDSANNGSDPAPSTPLATGTRATDLGSTSGTVTTARTYLIHATANAEL